MKKLILLLIILSVGTVNLFGQAIPKQISYQGVLKDASGNFVNGNQVLTFSIYNEPTGGTPLWTEIQVINLTNGLFNTFLGSSTPITGVPFDRIHFLGIQVGAETELTPRTMLTPTPYSFMAMDVMDNTVVKSLNSLKDNVNLVAGSNITLTPSGNNITISAASGGGGTVTQVNTGAGLTGGPITTTGTISVANNGITSAMLQSNSVTSEKISDGTIVTADLSNNSVTTQKINSSGASNQHVLQYNGSSVIWGYAPGSIINTTTLDANCSTVASFTTTYVKIANIGTFNKIDATSKLEITFYGRIYAGSVTGYAAKFELRVDNQATTNGRARADIRASEVGGTDGIWVSISGVFTGFEAGNHTVSMWVATSSGTGTNGMLDPGCFSTNHVVVREIK